MYLYIYVILLLVLFIITSIILIHLMNYPSFYGVYFLVFV